MTTDLPTATDDPPRALRADARRNRESVLQAAEAVFAAQGVGVPVDEVAKRAGVGVGTVYRHFPTKELLFEAIVLSRLERLTARLDELCAADGDAGTTFFAFLDEFSEEAASKRDLFDALANAGIDLKARDSASRPLADLRAAFAKLVERAQAAGTLRPDVSDEDVLGLVMGTCGSMAEGPGGTQPSRERMLAIVCDGLRLQPSH
ncbi:MAG TPA: TetR/AcrR family transcriptional regulator [Acidimicrobiales bacterium]|jgi:AcrR family transcriptional regulator